MNKELNALLAKAIARDDLWKANDRNGDPCDREDIELKYNGTIEFTLLIYPVFSWPFTPRKFTGNICAYITLVDRSEEREQWRIDRTPSDPHLRLTMPMPPLPHYLNDDTHNLRIDLDKEQSPMLKIANDLFHTLWHKNKKQRKASANAKEELALNILLTALRKDLES